MLPILHNNLEHLYWKDITNISYINSCDNLYVIKKKAKIINRFKFIYYGYRLRNWLYERVLQRIVKEKYHPSKLVDLLDNVDSDAEMEDKIGQWIR